MKQFATSKTLRFVGFALAVFAVAALSLVNARWATAAPATTITVTIPRPDAGLYGFEPAYEELGYDVEGSFDGFGFDDTAMFKLYHSQSGTLIDLTQDPDFFFEADPNTGDFEAEFYVDAADLQEGAWDLKVYFKGYEYVFPTSLYIYDGDFTDLSLPPGSITWDEPAYAGQNLDVEAYVDYFSTFDTLADPGQMTVVWYVDGNPVGTSPVDFASNYLEYGTTEFTIDAADINSTTVEVRATLTGTSAVNLIPSNDSTSAMVEFDALPGDGDITPPVIEDIYVLGRPRATKAETVTVVVNMLDDDLAEEPSWLYVGSFRYSPSAKNFVFSEGNFGEFESFQTDLGEAQVPLGLIRKPGLQVIFAFAYDYNLNESEPAFTQIAYIPGRGPNPVASGPNAVSVAETSDPIGTDRGRTAVFRFPLAAGDRITATVDGVADTDQDLYFWADGSGDLMAGADTLDYTLPPTATMDLYQLEVSIPDTASAARITYTLSYNIIASGTVPAASDLPLKALSPSGKAFRGAPVVNTNSSASPAQAKAAAPPPPPAPTKPTVFKLYVPVVTK